MITLTLFGETHPISVWVKRSGVSRSTILWRVNQGWEDDRVLEPAVRYTGSTKVCTSCHVEKTVSAFYKRSNRNGHLAWCKQCLNDYRKSVRAIRKGEEQLQSPSTPGLE
jgi:hypothetical protein